MKFTDISNLPIRHENVYRLTTGDGWDRLDITTSGSIINLILEIVDAWSAPYFVLYIHLVPRTAHAAGRYQSPAIDNLDELKRFLKLFQSTFEDDGRHSLWIAAPHQNRQVIYDPHEVLHVYGDNERVYNLLEERGYMQGEIRTPVPHAHHYHSEFDMDVDALMNYWS